eukprot:436247-Prymnesium_polylepis.2
MMREPCARSTSPLATSLLPDELRSTPSLVSRFGFGPPARTAAASPPPAPPPRGLLPARRSAAALLPPEPHVRRRRPAGLCKPPRCVGRGLLEVRRFRRVVAEDHVVCGAPGRPYARAAPPFASSPGTANMMETM